MYIKLKKIEKSNISKVLPLTPMQEGILLHYLKDKSSKHYFEQLDLDITGNINLKLFTKAWEYVIQLNEMLRVVYRWEGLDKPIQIILKHNTPNIKYIDISDINDFEKKQVEYEKIKIEDWELNFDLQDVPFRITLCRISGRDYRMIISNHHILYDGWSNGIILKEFFQAYNSIETLGVMPKVEPKVLFSEFIEWHKRSEKDKQRIFWETYLNGLEAQSQLPTVQKKQIPDNEPATQEISFTLENGIQNRLDGLIKRRRFTLAAVFYTLWGLLLHKYSGSTDVVFGTTVSGRSVKILGIENVVGLFINTVPLRLTSISGYTASKLMERINNDLIIREEFENSSLTEIKGYSQVQNDQELFDSLMVLENYPLDNRLISGNSKSSFLHINSYSIKESVPYPLTICILTGTGIDVRFIYDSKLFETSTITRLVNHFNRILINTVENIDDGIQYVELLSSDEKKQILADFNNCFAEFPENKTLCQLFKEKVEKNPDAIALMGIGDVPKTNLETEHQYLTLTYEELNIISDQLTIILIQQGVRIDTIVGLMLERSIEMIIGILGIIKAGAAYLPVDPQFPQERMEYLYKDSGFKIMVTDRVEIGTAKYPFSLIKPFDIDRLSNWHKDKLENNHCFPPEIHGKSAAYIIYTSGSTGKPKGVIINHSALKNTLWGLDRIYPFSGRDVYLLKTSYLFDVSLTELFGWFMGETSEGRLVILEPGLEKDTKGILDTIEKRGVTHINFVPSMFKVFVALLDSTNYTKLNWLKYIFLAGEALKPELVSNFRKWNTSIRLENLYGPTEAAIYASRFSLDEWNEGDNIPIGKPLFNVNIYILSTSGGLQPVGITGELAISGLGLARGYLNRPELTREKFTHDLLGYRHSYGKLSENSMPLDQYRHLPLYKSGDLSCWLEDGKIEFLGRLDFQVKIRGFRIELGEIENHLLKHNDIKEAVVLAKENTNKEKYICAYIVFHNTHNFSSANQMANMLEMYLLKYVPDYMVPRFFVAIDKIPLTTSCKVNWGALPEPVIEKSNKYSPPRDKAEQILVSIWAQLLNLEPGIIGIDDNFFQLGGHSLTITMLANRIYKEFNVAIPIGEIFKFPSIRAISKFINRCNIDPYSSVHTIEKKEYYPLSSAQSRMYVLHHLDELGHRYNINSIWEIRGDYNKEKLEKVLYELINRHDSLRTSFEIVEEKPVQRIHESIDFKIEYICKTIEENRQFEGKSTETTDDELIVSRFIRDFIRPFDLLKAPLFRAGLIEIFKKEIGGESIKRHSYLMIDMHHIISDGISVGILLDEFFALYTVDALPTLQFQYKDFSHWQHNRRNSDRLQRQESYWKKEFEGEVPILELPTDFPRPLIQSYEGNNSDFSLDNDTVSQLNAMASDYNCTLYIVLMAIYHLFLSGISGQEEIVIGTPVAGRRLQDLEGIIGLFINTLAIKNLSNESKKFSSFLFEVKEKIVFAFENQEYPYEDLIDRLGIDRISGRNPLFDTMFTLQTRDFRQISLPGLKLTPYKYIDKTAKFDLTLSALEKENNLLFTITYNTQLFTDNTIKRFILFFKKIISDILIYYKTDFMLSQIEIISEKEKRQLLFEFNEIQKGLQKGLTIHQAIESQVNRTPDHIALVGDSIEIKEQINRDTKGHPAKSTMTYREMWDLSGQMAACLVEKGIEVNSIVGIMVERSLEMVLVILTIFKSGGAYLPIDPNYPEERKHYLLKESGAKILLTRQEIGNMLSQIDYRTGTENSFSQHSQLLGSATSLAYVIYTSGSTGLPKGVMVEHRSVINLVYGIKETVFPYKYPESVMFVSPVYFDASVKQLFPTLVFGHRLIIATEEERIDGEKLIHLYKKYYVMVSDGTPAHLSLLLETMSDNNRGDIIPVQKFVIGGDILKSSLVEQVLARWITHFNHTELKIVNAYGPTECCDVTSTFTTTKSNYMGYTVIPIGKPINNTQIYIISRKKRLQPIGIVGELFISGDGVSRGYLNQPELTVEKFIQPQNFSPLDRVNLKSDSRHSPCPFNSYSAIYRTGDMARWLPDGNLEFLGRIDNQVKINGFRIELGEIENRLLKYTGITEAVVISKIGKNNENYLCAYGVSNQKLSILELREYLQNHLPEYMIPLYFIQLDKIPLTSRGKINHNALPAPKLKTTEKYVAPRNYIEHKLVQIWIEILKNESSSGLTIGIDDNFFRLGGNSLKATQYVSKVHKKLKIKVPLAEVFNNATIRGFAELVKDKLESNYWSINNTEEKYYYPLSSPQKRLYILHQMSGTGYNIPSIMKLEGDLDRIRLAETFQKLIEKHESLRTSFGIEQGEPVQFILKEVEFDIEFVELSETEVLSAIETFIRPFDLSTPPLLRVKLLKIESNTHILMIDIHHIISDGISSGKLIEEFTAFYADRKRPKLKLQYRDYVVWRDTHRENERIRQQEIYWKKEFESEIPILELPFDFTRPSTQTFEGDSISFSLEREDTNKLNTFVFKTGTTLFMVLLAAYSILLSKLSGEDNVVGVPVSGRTHADLEGIIGMFVNTLAIRNFAAGYKNVQEFIFEVKEKTLLAFENQDYPYEDLVNTVSIARDAGRNPLFDTMFSLQNQEVRELEIPGLKISLYPFRNKISKFDLMLSAINKDDILMFNFEYCTKLFKKTTIERFSNYYKTIIQKVILSSEKDITLWDIEIISEPEKKQILFEFNDTEQEYSKEKSIHRIFAEQVWMTPDRIALVGPSALMGDQERNSETKMVYASISYREMDKYSNLMACYLNQRGVAKGTIAGIMMRRSVEMILAMISILKAGGAYLPIDMEYPVERINYMLRDSKAQFIVTTTAPEQKKEKELKWEGQQVDIQNFYDLQKKTTSISEFPPQNQSSKDLAYIIYTSGSTGKPKGVLIEHCSVVNLALSQKHYFNVSVNDRILQFSSVCFDASVEQIFITIFSGAALILIDKETLLDTSKFEEYIASRSITHVHAVPSFLSQIKFKSAYALKRIVAGGEVCPVPTAKRWSRWCDFINEYGPTETTVTSIEVRFKYEDLDDSISRLPIGKAIANTIVYVLDKKYTVVPIGVPGQLFIGGDGLARGYLNKPEVTCDKFKNLKIQNIKKQLYETGDLGRWMANGYIEFLSRVDQQVKVRGFRIEPGEIEHQLMTHENIDESIVLCKCNENGENQLYAYFVSNKVISGTELRHFLSNHLPDYMIPTDFIRINTIPRTPTGKIDRKALPEPKHAIGQGYIRPRNSIEKQLVEIWAEVLRLETDRLGIDDNFFQLGGHSLKATIVISLIHKVLKVKVPLAEFFKNPTIRSQSQLVSTARRHEFLSVNNAETRTYYPLSSAQRRLYILHGESGIAYNISTLLTMTGNLYIDKIEGIFKKLVFRHDSLRTSFKLQKDEPVQRIHAEVKFEIDHQVTEDGAVPTAGSFIRPFDLSEAPLLRVCLLGIAPDKHVLIVDMHHIISDGYSSAILIKEFSTLYAGKELPPLKLQYKDYCVWQNSYKEIQHLQQQGEYWKKEFEGEIPVLELPTDFIRPAVQMFEGNKILFCLDKTPFTRLNSLSSDSGNTLYILLLAIYTIFLAKLSGQEEIVIGTPVAGRRHSDIQGIIGMFVNTLAIRNYPSSEKKWGEFLNEVREKALTAFENQEYPYEELVNTVVKNRDTSRNPLFDTLFTMQNIETETIEIPGIQISEYSYHNKTAKFDISLSVFENENTLQFTFIYCTKIFNEETITKFITYFKKIISDILIENPINIRLSEIEIISTEEKRQILFDFNDTRQEYPKEKTIHRLFEEQVERTPDCVAVCGNGRKKGETNQLDSAIITYRELNEQSDRLASVLGETGNGLGNIIGLLEERTIELVICIKAILKAGCGYLPIDLKAPQNRIDYIVKDSNLKILLTEQKITDLLSSNIHHAGKTGTSSKYSLSPGSNTSLAYVIYTSGSTGMPKGVMMEHGNVVNLIWSIKKIVYSYESPHSVALLSPFYFDASIKQIFPALLLGNKLFITTEQERINSEALIHFYFKNCINISDGTPIHLALLTEELNCSKLKEKLCVHTFLIGGEALKTSLYEKFIKGVNVDQETKNRDGIKIINVYGPTECCDITSTFSIDNKVIHNQLTIPIGKPIGNVNVFIVGKTRQLQPVGVGGELIVSGVGVARGYLNCPELTFEKFCFNVVDLFVKHIMLSHPSDNSQKGDSVKNMKPGKQSLPGIQKNKQYTKFYKTGDFARWLPDGNIEYLGRIDTQVKIRGYRIELEEIENRLIGYKGIKDSVVICRDNEGGENYLCAYIVSEENIMWPDLTDYLMQYLPFYMIPTNFVNIESIPLTANGKIDKKALPSPKNELKVDQITPRNTIEESLVEIWADVLGREENSISINSTFFELGGHSLKAIGIVNRIHKRFGIKITIQDIFRYSTIAKLAEIIKKSEITGFDEIKRLPEQPHYDISYSQKRLWFMKKKYPQSTAFNISARLALSEPVEEGIIQNTLKQLTERHESLRTSFKEINLEPVQVVESIDQVMLKYEFIDLSSQAETDPIKRCDIIAQEEKSYVFNLQQAPLFKAILIKCKDDHLELIIIMHHIISDGWSIEVLWQDFNKLLDMNKQQCPPKLPPLNIQYKDYVAWHNHLLENEKKIRNAKEFWKKSLGGTLPQLNLPKDFTTGQSNGNHSAAYRIILPESLKKQIDTVAGKYHASRFMILLAGFNLLLYSITRQTDILVGLPVAARSHESLKPIVGMFVNTLVIRTSFFEEESFNDYFNRFQLNVFNALEFQDFPLELICSELEIKYPDISAFFNMINVGTTSQQKLNNLNSYHIDSVQEAKFELVCYLKEYENGIEINCHYFKECFKPLTIERIMALYMTILEKISTEPQSKIKECAHSQKRKKISIL